MVALTALALAGVLAAPPLSFPPPRELALAARGNPRARARSWAQILSGFGLGLQAGPLMPLPLGDGSLPGVRFGVRGDFRLAAFSPGELDLVLPLFVRYREDGGATLGGVELMPAVGVALRPVPFLRLALEGGFGMLLLTERDKDGAVHDRTGIGVRASLPIEVQLAPHFWLGLTPTVLRDLTAMAGYGELMLGATWRY